MYKIKFSLDQIVMSWFEKLNEAYREPKLSIKEVRFELGRRKIAKTQMEGPLLG